MSSMVSKNQPSYSEADQNLNNTENKEETTENQSLVTTHLYLKSTHATGKLDKEVVLRQIRHRKRANNVHNAVQALFTSPFAANTNKAGPVQHVKWVDDAFSAP